MATTILDSMIITKAIDDAWNHALATFNGDLIRAAEFVQKGMIPLANRVSLQRSLAGQLDVESSPEAMRRRMDQERALREANAKADLAHGRKMADLAAQQGAAQKATKDAADAAMHRNGAHTAGM